MADAPPPIGKTHARRLREVYRSAGWPCQDLVEIELLAAGLLERVRAATGHETLRVTDAGIRLLAATLHGNRAARSEHETLVQRVAREMSRAGRVVWTGLSLRAQVPGPTPEEPSQWCIAMPDVFSIRNTTVEAFVEPVVHEIKVRRADLLADLKRPDKGAAYRALSSQCWYVLGPGVGTADDVPPEYGVLIATGNGLGDALELARPAPRRPVTPGFTVWMALARATPEAPADDPQAPLGPQGDAP